ncbi:MAG TPA: hypothetical protein VER03_06270 [Bryobacteraceae bacterium]|nr:hypothetical protein [Bryobacteraceae bacterium]
MNLQIASTCLVCIGLALIPSPLAAETQCLEAAVHGRTLDGSQQGPLTIRFLYDSKLKPVFTGALPIGGQSSMYDIPVSPQTGMITVNFNGSAWDIGNIIGGMYRIVLSNDLVPYPGFAARDSFQIPIITNVAHGSTGSIHVTVNVEGPTTNWTSTQLPLAASAADWVSRPALNGDPPFQASLSRPGRPALTVVGSLPGDGKVWKACALQPELLDPVPALLSGLAVTADVDRLERGGRPVAGVLTDGVTQTLLRMPALREGERITLRVLTNCFDENDPQSCSPSTNLDDDGGVAALGASTFVSEQEVQAVKTPSGPLAFALYRAPLEFTRTAQDHRRNQRVLYVELQGEGGYLRHRKVLAIRPPVLLVHGVWSDHHTWRHFVPVLRAFGLQPLRADYSEPDGAAEGFNVNAIKLYDHIRRTLQLIRTGGVLQLEQIAGTQLDIVAHSMGGMVTRTMALLPGFPNPENFMKGYVRRMITINTPHLGTRFAVKLEEQIPTCDFVFGALKFSTDKGAVTDLRSDSSMVKALQVRQGLNGIRTHAIIGTASDTQIRDSERSWGTFIVNIACPSVLPGGKFSNVFEGQKHDLIVPEDSMAALALGASGIIPVTRTEPFVHTVLPLGLAPGPDVLNRNCPPNTKGLCGNDTAVAHTGEIPNKVVHLLNSRSTEFAPILPTFGR